MKLKKGQKEKKVHLLVKKVLHKKNKEQKMEEKEKVKEKVKKEIKVKFLFHVGSEIKI